MKKVCLHVLSPARTNIRALRAATALAKAGFMVTLVDIEHHVSEARASNLATKFIITSSDVELENVHTRHVYLPARLARFYEPDHVIPWLLFKALRMICAIITLLRTSDDIYHASDVTAFPACYIAALLRRKPLILEFYDMPLESPRVSGKKWLYALTARALRLMIARSSAVISPSIPMIQEMQRRYGGKRGFQLRNLPPYQTPPTSNRLRESLDLDPQVRIALYQGNLMKDRGLDVIVRAARFLDPGIVIVFLGKGEVQAELEELIIHDDVAERVKLLPPVPYAELLTWTASADIGLILLSPEHSLNVRLSLPNKFFEYLMVGLPVLTSKLDAVAEITTSEDVGWVVSSFQPATIAAAINALASDEEARKRMRKNALAACQGDLNWNAEGEKLAQLYYDLLSMPHSEAPALQRR